jgi:hypothetical protein
MDLKAAARLRLIGLLVVLLMVMLLWLPMVIGDKKLDYSDAIASTIAIGIGLLLLAEVGPAIKTLKAGGIEVEFLDTVTGKFNTLETRVAALELAAKHPGQPVERAKELHSKKPPALNQPITVKDDPQSGRWGGQSESDGFKLSATFRHSTKHFVEIVLRVDDSNPARAKPADGVEFYLHDSFNPDVVPVPLTDGFAELSLLAYGGFTVGVWIQATETQLELDLSKIKGAPIIIRDL